MSAIANDRRAIGLGAAGLLPVGVSSWCGRQRFWHAQVDVDGAVMTHEIHHSMLSLMTQGIHHSILPLHVFDVSTQ